MAVFPQWNAGARITAARLASMLPNVVTKEQQDVVQNKVAFQTDTELQGIPLTAGRWSIRFLLFVTGDVNGIGDVKFMWNFSGTWVNFSRACRGPQLGSTGPENTAVRLNAFSVDTASTYGLANSGTFATVEEEANNVNVTAPGFLSLSFAQITAVTNSTILRIGSTAFVRQTG